MSNPSDKVGYKNPPLATRFKPGTSGNPKGRPKGARSFASLLDDVLNQTVAVVENGRRRNIRKSKAIAIAIVNKAIKSGDPKAIATIMAYSDRLRAMVGEETAAGAEIDELIIGEYLGRRNAGGGHGHDPR